MDNLYTEAFALDGQKVWYSVMPYNMLYCLDLETSENRFVDVFPENYCGHVRLHCRAIKKKNKIYFIPDSGGYIHVLYLHTGTIKAIEIEAAESDIRFLDAVEHDGKIFMFCNGDKLRIYCFDTEEEICKPLEMVCDGIAGRVMKYPEKIGQKVYLAGSEYPQIVIFDCEENRLEILALNECREGIGTIVYDGNAFWSSTKTGFVQWDKDGQVLCRIDGFPDEFKTWKFSEAGSVEMADGFYDGGKKNEFPFWASAVIDDKVYFLSRMTNMNVAIDLHTQEVSKASFPDEEETEETLLRERVTCNHYFGEKIGETLYISSSCSGKFYIISPKGKKEYTLARDRKDETACFRQRGTNFKYRIFHENDEVTLPKYISYLCEDDSISRHASMENKGNIIYQTIKEVGR